MCVEQCLFTVIYIVHVCNHGNDCFTGSGPAPVTTHSDLGLSGQKNVTRLHFSVFAFLALMT